MSIPGLEIAERQHEQLWRIPPEIPDEPKFDRIRDTRYFIEECAKQDVRDVNKWLYDKGLDDYGCMAKQFYECCKLYLTDPDFIKTHFPSFVQNAIDLARESHRLGYLYE